MHKHVVIGFRRPLSLGATVLFGVLAVVGIERGIATHSVFAVVMGVIVAGLPCVYYANLTFRRRPYVTIDDAALVIDRRGVGSPWRRAVIPWSSIFEAEIRERQSVFGLSHALVLTIRREDKPRELDAVGLQTSRVSVETVRLSLDMLSVSWRDFVALMEERLGRSIATSPETASLSLTKKADRSRP